MLFDKIAETTAYIKSRITLQPIAGIVLGSGLGDLAKAVTVATEISYADIPHFPQSTVEGHAGKMIFGTLNGCPVMMMAGRFHYYEGYDMQQVTFPVRVMKALGVQTLLVSNAAGGMDKNFKVGDIMFIRDHINLFPEHPLRGPNDSRLGTRFPDMSEPYSYALLGKAREIAASLHIPVQEGVYIGLQGPTFETRAEYGWLHVIGGHAVGMSTVPEVIVAIHGGMKVFAASIITDLGIRDELNVITHEEVLEAANAAAPKLSAIFAGIAGSLV
ncbi:MAG: purine-nucleoside phosphorylase [Edaphocola sp.]